MENIDQIQSRTINLLRFPMAVLVVFCHCKLLWGISDNGITEINNGYLFQSIQIFYSEVIPHVAIPIFLFFSGYLFFYNVDFNKEVYLNKLKKRASSLLLPYFIWCTIGYIISVANNECTLSAITYIQGFWDTSLWNESGNSLIAFSNLLADMPLWFIRDLIIIIILSPLVYLVAKYKHGIGMIIAACGFILLALGSWFAIHKLNFIQATKPLAIYSTIAALILMSVDFVIVNQKFSELGKMGYNWYVFNAFILTGALSIIHVTSWLVKENKLNISSFWAPASFFLFAIHALYMYPLRVLLFDIFKPVSQTAWIAFYFVDIFIVIILALILFYILRKYLPKACAVLTGGRI